MFVFVTRFVYLHSDFLDFYLILFWFKIPSLFFVITTDGR